jgi:hypothetical protein
MATTLRAAIMPHKSTFVSFELPMVKLKHDFDKGSYKEKKYPGCSMENTITRKEKGVMTRSTLYPKRVLQSSLILN